MVAMQKVARTTAISGNPGRHLGQPSVIQITPRKVTIHVVKNKLWHDTFHKLGVNYHACQIKQRWMPQVPPLPQMAADHGNAWDPARHQKQPCHTCEACHAKGWSTSPRRPASKVGIFGPRVPSLSGKQRPWPPRHMGTHCTTRASRHAKCRFLWPLCQRTSAQPKTAHCFACHICWSKCSFTSPALDSAQCHSCRTSNTKTRSLSPKQSCVMKRLQFFVF